MTEPLDVDAWLRGRYTETVGHFRTRLDLPTGSAAAVAAHSGHPVVLIVDPVDGTLQPLGLADAVRRTAPGGLTLAPREKEVLDLLVDGLTVPQIARRLRIAESTARTLVANLHEKLGARPIEPPAVPGHDRRRST